MSSPSLLTSLACAVLCLLSSCSTLGSAPVGDAAKIEAAFRGGGQEFILVSQSHTDRVQLYSQTRANANTKVQTDEVMDELVMHFRKQGFFKHAAENQAGAWKQVITLDVGPQSTVFGINATSSVAARAAFKECMTALLSLYSSTYQLQSVHGAQLGG